ncbi:MAG: type II toxin-antitoxin system VapC family toxin [Patescibacteria group bacterium]
MDGNGRFVVVDASIALAWLCPDEKVVEEVNRLFERSVLGEINFAAPAILRYEIWNGLRNMVLRKRMESRLVFEALARFESLQISFFDQEADGRRIMEVAIREGLTAYDGAYLVLARSLGCDLMSNDKKLKALAVVVVE